MQTNNRLHAGSAAGDAAWIAAHAGEGMRAMSHEIEFRRERLAAEAARERLVGEHEGLRRWIGHRLMALGRAIHGLEPDPSGGSARPALRTR